MHLPIDNEVLQSSLDQEDDPEDHVQKIQILLASRKKVFKEVEANIEVAKEPKRNV